VESLRSAFFRIDGTPEPYNFVILKPPMNPVIDVLNKLTRVPSEPGVYLMKDASGMVIYIGKARNLKKRLASYYKTTGHLDIKAGILVDKINDIETIITRTEKEALILESNLIKKHKPRYNVILKDDKRYPSLRIDLKEKYPNFSIVRKIGLDDALYFGPFALHRPRRCAKHCEPSTKHLNCASVEPKISKPGPVPASIARWKDAWPRAVSMWIRWCIMNRSTTPSCF